MCTCTTSSVITQNGWSALIRAASEGHTGVVVELVKARANLDLQDKVCHCQGCTCSHVTITMSMSAHSSTMYHSMCVLHLHTERRLGSNHGNCETWVSHTEGVGRGRGWPQPPQWGEIHSHWTLHHISSPALHIRKAWQPSWLPPEVAGLTLLTFYWRENTCTWTFRRMWESCIHYILMSM